MQIDIKENTMSSLNSQPIDIQSNCSEENDEYNSLQSMKPFEFDRRHSCQSVSI